jgi:hypothetical protein
VPHLGQGWTECGHNGHTPGHVITIVPTLECARWRWDEDSTSSLVRSRADWWKTATVPCVEGTAPRPLGF